MKRSKKIILGFVGELGSGKTTASKYLIKKYKAGYHQYSGILSDIANRLYLEKSRNNLQKLSLALRQTFGQDILAKTITQEVEKDKSKIVLVDGIRRFPDIKYLKKLQHFSLVYLTADLNLRFQRIKKRKEKPGDSQKSFKQFQKEEKNEADRMIKIVAKKAHFTVTNNTTFNHLYQQLDEIISKLI